MDQPIVLFLSILMAWVVFGFAAKRYVAPALGRLSKEDALIPLILPHGIRYLGLGFLLPGLAAPSVAETSFASYAAYGDILASILAIAAVFALHFRWPFAILLAWIFNIEGSIDFIVALAMGLQQITPAQLGGMYLIPMLIAPALMVTHVLAFGVLLRKT